ncbi:MAG: hypothetical protein C4B59_12800 [Candidatus Methanogaster sp.]|uniref:Uncharacterized protein n=1 Tax=Candidatus Methanogaster sp. TaxID=3386292 RepID=A0AC61L097_9EURY|nr:MAG: hypothetical protein C4B59_12800 [ANME-2 cluster archaeon]
MISLEQGSTVPREQVIGNAANIFGFDADVLRDVVSLRVTERSLSAEESEDLYGRFMAVVSGIAEEVERME